tara:strand:+ start:574 stop:930 length:357 start_codon:yes stop_codon:yes gene_type:complete
MDRRKRRSRTPSLLSVPKEASLPFVPNVGGDGTGPVGWTTVQGKPAWATELESAVRAPVSAWLATVATTVPSTEHRCMLAVRRALTPLRGDNEPAFTGVNTGITVLRDTVLMLIMIPY